MSGGLLMKTFQVSRLEISHLWALTVGIGVFAFVNTHPIQPFTPKRDYSFSATAQRFKPNSK